MLNIQIRLELYIEYQHASYKLYWFFLSKHQTELQGTKKRNLQFSSIYKQVNSTGKYYFKHFKQLIEIFLEVYLYKNESFMFKKKHFFPPELSLIY